MEQVEAGAGELPTLLGLVGHAPRGAVSSPGKAEDVQAAVGVEMRPVASTASAGTGGKLAISITDAVTQLLRIVADLQAAFPKKRFTLDGRLLGDIGEVLVEAAYDATIFDGVEKHHDAVAADDRRVQIKATMKDSLTFPADHVPDFYIGIKIKADGSFEEVFNGPGRQAAMAIAGRVRPKTNLHSISVTRLRELNKAVVEQDRIPRRRTAKSQVG